MDENLAIKITSYRFQVNPNVVSFAYNGMDGIRKLRGDYLELKSQVDLETGKIKTKLTDGKY